MRSVFGVSVKDGVLNDTEFALPQLAGWSGPVNVNLTTTICVVLAQALYVGKDCVAMADSTVVLMDATTRRSTPSSATPASSATG